MCCANSFWKMAHVLQQFRQSTEANQSERAVHLFQWPRSKWFVLSASSAVELQRRLSEILDSTVRVCFLWPNPISHFFKPWALTPQMALNHFRSFSFGLNAGDPTSCCHETCVFGQVRCWKKNIQTCKRAAGISWNGSVNSATSTKTETSASVNFFMFCLLVWMDRNPPLCLKTNN